MQLDSTTVSRKLDEVVTLLVGGHPGSAAVRFRRLAAMVPNVSETSLEVSLKGALAHHVGLVKVDKFWTDFSLARQALATKSVA